MEEQTNNTLAIKRVCEANGCRKVTTEELKKLTQAERAEPPQSRSKTSKIGVSCPRRGAMNAWPPTRPNRRPRMSPDPEADEKPPELPRPRQLPIVVINVRRYYVDERLREYRRSTTRMTVS
jgi:hypothetical protein